MITEEEFIPITKFANLVGLSRSALIFYDESGLFFPEGRGENGYRYYSPRQIVTINFVNTLRALDVPLKKIRELARERTPEQLVELLLDQSEILSAEIQRIQGMHQVISTLLATMQSGLDINEDEISVRFMPSSRISIGPKTDFKSTGNFYRPFLDYCDWARQRGQSLNYPIGGYTETAESFQAAPGRPDRFFSLDPAGRDRRPAGEYLVGYGRGYYGEADAAAARLLAYAREHGLKLAGPVYQIYLFDELVLREEDKFLLQIAVRLAGPGK